MLETVVVVVLKGSIFLVFRGDAKVKLLFFFCFKFYIVSGMFWS